MRMRVWQLAVLAALIVVLVLATGCCCCCGGCGDGRVRRLGPPGWRWYGFQPLVEPTVTPAVPTRPAPDLDWAPS